MRDNAVGVGAERGIGGEDVKLVSDLIFFQKGGGGGKGE